MEKYLFTGISKRIGSGAFYLLLIMIGACRDKYVPKLNEGSTSLLVVEGFINVGNGPTHIQLTRTTGLDSIYLSLETGAAVEVQSDNGASYALGEDTAGEYSIPQVPANPGQKYRIHIKTSNGKDYVSDYSEIKITPPIDSVGWKNSGEVVSIYVNTHDDQNQTIYYQWQFEETWKYHTGFQSALKIENAIVKPRPPEEMIYTCWRSTPSTNIEIASSAKLNEDVIFEFPLTQIDYTSTDKINILYSILVKQFALSKEWYEWKQKVKRNTEQLGSIFDALPSETGGNIHCENDPAEKVVGFVGCTTETDKRIYISHAELNTLITFNPYRQCTVDTIEFGNSIYPYFLESPSGVVIDYATSMGFPIGLLWTQAECGDCRTRGGTTTKPDFWP